MLKAPQYFEFQARHAVQRVAPRARLDNRYAAVSARTQHPGGLFFGQERHGATASTRLKATATAVNRSFKTAY